MTANKITPANVWDYKKQCELPHFWNLRKDFLLSNSESGIPNDRLVCLSNIFINIEIMGLEYDEKIMNEVKSLGQNLKELQRYKMKLASMSQEQEDERPRKVPAQQNRNRWSR